MRRRRFLGSLGRGALGLGLLPPVLHGCGSREAGAPAAEEPSTEPFTGWTWVHGGADRTPEEWRARFAELRSAGLHGVLVSGGDTTMLSDAARGAGLEFHRWLWILNRNGDRFAMDEHPEWFTVNRLGVSTLEEPPYVGYYRWVCPSREPVREYLNQMIADVADDPAVDGVHLDYIRYCDVILPSGLWDTYGLVQDHELPEFDYCYCEVCRAEFEGLSGRDPLELDNPPADGEWVRYRWDSVTRLVNELSDTVHARNKPITAAVFPGPSVARRLVRQSWDEWRLDIAFPMLYHSFYEEDLAWVEEMAREGVAATEATGARLVAGLYLPDLIPTELARAIERVKAAGAAGFSTFEMNGLTPEHLAVIRAGDP